MTLKCFRVSLASDFWLWEKTEMIYLFVALSYVPVLHCPLWYYIVTDYKYTLNIKADQLCSGLILILQGGPKKSLHLHATNFNITQIALLTYIWWQNVHKWKGYTRKGLFFSVSAFSCHDYFQTTSENVTGLLDIVFCHFGQYRATAELWGFLQASSSTVAHTM